MRLPTGRLPVDKSAPYFNQVSRVPASQDRHRHFRHTHSVVPGWQGVEEEFANALDNFLDGINGPFKNKHLSVTYQGDSPYKGSTFSTLLNSDGKTITFPGEDAGESYDLNPSTAEITPGVYLWGRPRKSRSSRRRRRRAHM